MRRSTPLLLLPLMLLTGLTSCGRGGGEREVPEGARIEIHVAESVHHFDHTVVEFGEFLGETSLLEVTSYDHQGEVTFSLGFLTPRGSLAELQGETLEAVYAADNPEGYPLEDIFNFFELGSRHYQGHEVSLEVTSVGDPEVGMTLSGTYLVFTEEQLDWVEEPPRGEEVEVLGSFHAPIVR